MLMEMHTLKESPHTTPHPLELVGCSAPASISLYSSSHRSYSPAEVTKAPVSDSRPAGRHPEAIGAGLLSSPALLSFPPARRTRPPASSPCAATWLMSSV